MITDKLISEALKRTGDKKISDIRIGLGYVCTLLDDGSCGLSYVFKNELSPCCGQLNEAGSLIGRGASELVDWALSSDILKSSVGVSVINSLLNNKNAKYEDCNIIGKINVKPEDTFGMVGYFYPVFEKIKQTGAKQYIFERAQYQEENIMPDWAMDIYLPKCDIILITGTAVINKTIDHILSLCKNAREVFIVGPSTPLFPGAFNGYNVTALAGSIVVDPINAIDIISQGGGTINLKKAVKHVLLDCNS